jgi:multiple sugar transport system permease protein
MPVGLLFILPWLIGFLIFVVYPLVASFYYSFTFYPILGRPQFSGLENYIFLANDRLFKTATYNTAYFAILSVPTGILIAFLLALVMNRELLLRPLYRTIFYVPTLVPGVASAILWLWLFNSQFGLINMAFRAVGLPTIPFLSSMTWSKPALVMMTWWGVGGWMLILLAALQDVPASLYDAASIDGAGAWSKVRHVTLPMISPAFFFLFVTGLIGAFQTFTASYFMTNGGPADSTLMYALYIYRVAFDRGQMGFACTLAWVLLVIVGILTAFVFRSSGAWVFYSGGTGGK